MKSTVFFIFFLLILSVPTFCQNNSIKVYTSYGIGHPDTRLGFINPFLASHLRENGHKYTPDDEYSFGLEYNFKIKKNLSIGLEIGYGRLVQDFFIPINNLYFRLYNKGLFWRENSIYSMIQMSPRIDYVVIDKRVKLGVNLQGVSNVSYHKQVHINDVNLNRSKTEYFATEVYPGVFLQYWRLRLNIGWRALHWKYRDDAIANNGLNPDRYNPFKMRFGLSYDVLRW